ITAIEMMAFGADADGVKAFIGSPALMGDLGTSYIGEWIGEAITLGASVSAFACCLACVVGASRLLFALTRDFAPDHALGRTRANGSPGVASALVSVLIAVIGLVCATAFHAEPFDTFLWSGTIGTLMLIVAYVLATIGCIKLFFIDKKMQVPQWQVVIPVLALAMLVYTMFRNVWPYPTEGAAQWFPLVSFGWLILVAAVAIAFPGLARRLTAGLAASDREDAQEPTRD
ncbi:MAG: amino acid permease, partial [Nocardioidaceae bacterium]